MTYLALRPRLEKARGTTHFDGGAIRGREPELRGSAGAGARRDPEIAAALEWTERASLPAAELEDTATVRLALAACAKTLTGKAAAGSTQRRKRSVFYNALGYAVEQGHLAANPIDRIQ
jgi:hypothetical protein